MPKENTMPDSAGDPKELQEPAARVIQQLWDTGFIEADRLEPLLPGGRHRYRPKQSTQADKALGVLQGIMPDLLIVLQGVLPEASAP